MTQQDRIEAMLITVLENQIKLAHLGYNIAPSNVGVEATRNGIVAAAENAIDFVRAERKVHDRRRQ